ncbi:hypothetical protein ATK36_2591 [Amycolatopsis sulphurea]|uniref:PPE family protein n=1 Tax=Amycolatopsis sulphurea TaxID=76022 RepID=A0A2A9F9T3_9PSEU|nr:hypothetical protein [Amycolatopsis sulphurea]PFG47546.1 hypothetical protein ATK36_2591 [Amycolatopsis sulphurea]
MDGQRATYRQYEGDYYSDTRTELSKQAAPGRFGIEDQHNVQDGVDARTQQAASNYSVTQGQHLLEDQALRGDAPAPDANYASHDHQDLYTMVHTNMDPTDLDAKGRVANALGNWLAEISNSISVVTQTSGASWQGAAADQAHSFFQQTASYAAQTANAAQLNSNRYSQQSAAADYAQKNMPEPTGFNQQAELNKVTQQLNGGDPLTAAVTMNQLSQKQQQADAAHQQAVQVMHGLDNAYHETSTTQPTYSPPPRLNGDSTHASSAAPVTAPGGPVSSGPYSGPGGNGSSTVVPPAGSTGNAPFTPPPPVSGSGGAPLPGPGISTGAGSFNNPANTAPGFRGPTGPGGIGGRLSPDALSMGGGGNVGNAGENTPRSRPGIGTGRSGGGNAGSRLSGGGGAGGTPSEREGGGKGKAGNLERGAKSAAEASKNGKPGVAGGATGNGRKKEEDQEHKNKIPAQLDPDEVFEVHPERGPDGEKITPPVIGG